MQQLYIVRHADAEPTKTTDAERRLTPKGERQAAKIGRFCAEQELDVGPIFSSPLVRAVQTAEFLAKPLATEVKTSRDLASGMTPGRLRAFLREHQSCDSLLIVGHEPDLSRAVADLLGCEPERVRVKKATLLRLCFEEAKLELATLDFLVPVNLL
ncbi:MAG: phosphohistidine phosphatase SixA [Verrucomicrobia bacterium]|nr:phosphohistidine phosphatase SixA [Verrucomicrobiota bacterium]